MPAASTVRGLLIGVGVTLCLLGASGAAVVRWSAAATPLRVAAVTDASPMAPVTTIGPSTTGSTSTPTTSSSPTSTSTTSVTPTTFTAPPTTGKPRPVATMPSSPTPTAPPVPAPVPARVAAAPTGASPEQRCMAALQWVAAQGLTLPAGWGFRCPGRAVVNGADRWGLACWNCEGPGSWIAVDIGRIGLSELTLRYVVAHETCHANDYALLGVTTELGADLCAALHGAPRP